MCYIGQLLINEVTINYLSMLFYRSSAFKTILNFNYEIYERVFALNFYDITHSDKFYNFTLDILHTFTYELWAFFNFHFLRNTF